MGVHSFHHFVFRISLKTKKMKESNASHQTLEQLKNNLCLVPEHFLQNVINGQEKILQLLEGKSNTSLNGFITEKQASEILHKKATWFWQIRKSGQLPFRRIGKTIYYALADINSLLDSKL